MTKDVIAIVIEAGRDLPVIAKAFDDAKLAEMFHHDFEEVIEAYEALTTSKAANTLLIAGIGLGVLFAEQHRRSQ